MNTLLFHRRILGFLFGLLILGGGGCLSVGPDYRRPETRIPDAWNQAVTQDLASGSSPVVTWWDLFNDPTLSLLIQDAAQANLDL